MIIIPICWLLLIAYNSKYASQSKFYHKVFNRNQSLALRGICAVEIMIGHIGSATKDWGLFPNRKAGILVVGIFFLLSGYGLSYGLLQKENYMDSFLTRRAVKILLPALSVWAAAAVIQFFLEGSWQGISSFFQSVNWYVWELLGCYLCFWLTYRWIDTKHKGACVWGGDLSCAAVSYSFCLHTG